MKLILSKTLNYQIGITVSFNVNLIRRKRLRNTVLMQRKQADLLPVAEPHLINLDFVVIRKIMLTKTKVFI